MKAAAKSSIVKITKETVRARCWRSIGTWRRFTRADLIATAQAKDANIEEMLQGLIRAGYIRIDRANRPERRAAHFIRSRAIPVRAARWSGKTAPSSIEIQGTPDKNARNQARAIRAAAGRARFEALKNLELLERLHKLDEVLEQKKERGKMAKTMRKKGGVKRQGNGTEAEGTKESKPSNQIERELERKSEEIQSLKADIPESQQGARSILPACGISITRIGRVHALSVKSASDRARATARRGAEEASPKKGVALNDDETLAILSQPAPREMKAMKAATRALKGMKLDGPALFSSVERKSSSAAAMKEQEQIAYSREMCRIKPAAARSAIDELHLR